MKTLELIIITMGCVLSSCHKDEVQSIIVDIGIGVTIETKDGIDLLNPETPNAIKKQDIQVFYEAVDGHRETYVSTSGVGGVILDNPAGFTLSTNADIINGNQRYFLDIFSNGAVGKSITIIAIAGRGEVKLVSEVAKTSNGNLLIKKIWYQDNLVWPVPNNDGPKCVRIIL